MPLINDSLGRSVVPLIINNTNLPIEDPGRVCPVKASTGDEPVHYFYSADVTACKDACKAAWNAFDGGWKRASISTRRDLLHKVAALYEERADELVRIQKLETSCPEPWARSNVALSIAYIKETAACISGVHGIADHL